MVFGLRRRVLVRLVVCVRQDEVHVERQVVRQPLQEQRQVRVGRQRVQTIQNLKSHTLNVILIGEYGTV